MVQSASTVLTNRQLRQRNGIKAITLIASNTRVRNHNTIRSQLTILLDHTPHLAARSHPPLKPSVRFSSFPAHKTNNEVLTATQDTIHVKPASVKRSVT